MTINTTVQAIVRKLKAETANRIVTVPFHKFTGRSAKDKEVVKLAGKIVDRAVYNLIKKQIDLDNNFEPL